MPSEYREIRFSNDEVARALHEYAAAQSGQGPPKNPNSLTIEREPEVSVKLRFGNDPAVTYSALETTAAILRLAKRIGVPIARRARKALTVDDEALVLKLWID